MSNVRKAKHGWVLTLIFSLISIAYIMPIVIVLMNSFKRKIFISNRPFALPDAKSFVKIENYINGIQKTDFFRAFGYTLFITVGSVFVIVLCTSMCAWYISRVKNKWTTGIYYLFAFSMIVPFQMVMFTLSKIADILHLGNPVGIIIVYLGFGAGLAVFMFCGFVRSIPLEIEESAMIDGCTERKALWKIIMPMATPGVITVTIFNFMGIWNEYFIALIFANGNDKIRTLSMGLQNMITSMTYTGNWAGLFASIMIVFLPTFILYLFLSEKIVAGVTGGGVKG